MKITYSISPSAQSQSHLQHPPLSREWLLHTSNHASLIPEIANVQGLPKAHKYQFPRAPSLQLHSCIQHGSITALFYFLLLIPRREGGWGAGSVRTLTLTMDGEHLAVAMPR